MRPVSALHVHAWGPPEGAPVLVLHGVTNTGARYRRLAQDHLADLRVIAVDLRGHADSTWDPPWSLERHVEDVRETLEALGVSRACVVGHSFGGLVALHLAATVPKRVAALVLLDPAGALDPARCGREAEQARRDEGWADRAEARAARLALRPPHSRDTVDEDLDVFLRECPDGRVRFRFSRGAAVAAWSEMARPAPSLAGYPGRVELVVAGQADYVSDALRDALRRDLSTRLTEWVVDAGHQLFWDAPDEVRGIVRRAVEAP